MSSNYPTVCQVLYCAWHSCVGNKKCFAFVVLLMLFCVKCEDLPKNVVVMSGADKVFNCAEGEPFRWYRYLPSDPSNDKVLFMGSRMADNLDKRFRVIREPANYPYQRLDLLITDIQANHSGTYKCRQPQSAQCAELIVLSSEPKCKIHASKDTTATDEVELKCSIDVTENGQPEMMCIPRGEDTVTGEDTLSLTPCSSRDNGMVTCLTKVPAVNKADYTCFIKIKHNPLFNDKMCIHASNEPDYLYTWQSSSGVCDDASTISHQLSVKQLSFIFAAVCAVAAALNIILFLFCHKRRMQGYSSRKDSDTSSVETQSSDCVSLTSEGQEEVKESLHIDPDIPKKIDV